jgi:hypothetical protein
MQADVQVEKKEDLALSKGNAGLVEIWSKELENSDNYEKNWRKEADKYFQIYRDEYNGNYDDSRRYNVFWANTQTLRPLVFSKLPKPNITQRFLDEDEVAKLASEMMERTVFLYLGDSDAEDTIGKCRDDFLIGGRGVARVCYDPEEILELEDGAEEIDPSKKKCRIEYWPWEDFRMSTEKEWSKVRWIAFRHYMTREELVEDFGSKGKAVSLNKTRLDSLDKSPSENELFKMAEVWEIWDKDSGKVIFATLGGDGTLLSSEEDPYNLRGFFPMPMPLGSKSDPSSLIPTPLYRFYKSQAEELNKVDARIKSLIEQCKATGIYNSVAESSDIEALFNGEDGTFSPLKGTGGLQKASDMVLFKPLNEIILAIRELQQHKIEIINAIRDITGISDIVRGVSMASETATAQQLKGNFAISRIQPLQKEIEFWSRDLIRLLVELTVENYSLEELVQMTGLKIVDIETIAAQAQDRLKVLMMEAQRQIAPNDPQAAEKMDMLKQQAEKGFKETMKQPLEILKGYACTPQQLDQLGTLIKNDKMRTFSVDVETDSTIRIDQQQEKQDRIEYIVALGNFSKSFFPLVQAQIITPEAFQQFLMFVSKPFKVGRNVEEALQKDAEPQEKQPTAEEMLAQAQIQLEQQKLQLEAQKVQSDASLKQQEINIEKAKQLFEMEKHQDNMEFEDVNRQADRQNENVSKQADREANRLDLIVKARTEVLNDTIREANKPTEI